MKWVSVDKLFCIGLCGVMKVLLCIPSLAAFSRASDQIPSARRGIGSSRSRGCQNTYYIHEYHVHEDGTVTNKLPTEPELEGPSISGDVIRLPGDEITRQTVTYDDLIDQRESCSNSIKVIQDDLFRERNEKVEILLQMIGWINEAVSLEQVTPGERSGHNKVLIHRLLALSQAWGQQQTNATLSERIREIINTTEHNQKEYLESVASQESSVSNPNSNVSGVVDSDAAEHKQLPENEVVKPPPKSAQKNEGTSSPTIKPGNTEFTSLPSFDEDVDLKSLARQFEHFKLETNMNIKNLDKSVKRTKRQYAHLYQLHKRLRVSYRHIHRDVRRWESRGDRLLLFHEDGISNLEAAILNKTSVMQTYVNGLNDRVNVFEERVSSGSFNCSCPIGADTKGDTSNGDVSITDDTRPEMLPLAGNFSTMTSLKDMILAGREVTSWHINILRKERPKDCSDIDLWTQREQPIQTIYLFNRTFPIRVQCEEGWTVIQRNAYYNSGENIDTSSWGSFKNGFGTLSGEIFWIGLSYMHWLTIQEDYKLSIDLEKTGDTTKLFSLCAYFKVGNESEFFRLQASDCEGSAGDILGFFSPTPLTLNPFSTTDHYKSGYSVGAEMYRTGWWYPDREFVDGSDGFPEPCFTHLTQIPPWYCSDEGGGGGHYLNTVKMKIKPNTKD